MSVQHSQAKHHSRRDKVKLDCHNKRPKVRHLYSNIRCHFRAKGLWVKRHEMSLYLKYRLVRVAEFPGNTWVTVSSNDSPTGPRIHTRPNSQAQAAKGKINKTINARHNCSTCKQNRRDRHTNILNIGTPLTGQIANLTRNVENIHQVNLGMQSNLQFLKSQKTDIQAELSSHDEFLQKMSNLLTPATPVSSYLPLFPVVRLRKPRTDLLGTLKPQHLRGCQQTWDLPHPPTYKNLQ